MPSSLEAIIIKFCGEKSHCFCGGISALVQIKTPINLGIEQIGKSKSHKIPVCIQAERMNLDKITDQTF